MVFSKAGAIHLEQDKQDKKKERSTFGEIVITKTRVYWIRS
jgi:hypothetical protein